MTRSPLIKSYCKTVVFLRTDNIHSIMEKWLKLDTKNEPRRKLILANVYSKGYGETVRMPWSSGNRTLQNIVKL